MNATIVPPTSFLDRGQLVPWLLVLAGLMTMYGPTFWDLGQGIWQSDDYSHGPIVLAVVGWLFWQVRGQLLAAPAKPSNGLGWPSLVVGLLLYVLGRSQDILAFEVGSLLVVLAGALLAMQGPSGVRAAWFPLLYLLFLVPLPGSLVDALTGPLKHYVSVLAEQGLYAIGYPIARQGVVLHVGQYQLLVADACSGLHSIFSLGALGLLFMYLMKRESWLHNGILLLSIAPIAFLANVIRVMVLVLVTYHMGDEAGQGFLHGAAGMVLWIAGLLSLFALDWMLTLVVPKPSKARSQ